MLFGKSQDFIIGEVEHIILFRFRLDAPKFHGFQIILCSMNEFLYKKLVVVGTTGSGKSTLAEQLAGKLGGDFIELDALNWGTNWTPADDEVLRSRVEQATLSSC